MPIEKSKFTPAASPISTEGRVGAVISAPAPVRAPAPSRPNAPDLDAAPVADTRYSQIANAFTNLWGATSNLVKYTDDKFELSISKENARLHAQYLEDPNVPRPSMADIEALGYVKQQAALQNLGEIDAKRLASQANQAFRNGELSIQDLPGFLQNRAGLLAKTYGDNERYIAALQPTADALITQAEENASKERFDQHKQLQTSTAVEAGIMARQSSIGAKFGEGEQYPDLPTGIADWHQTNIEAKVTSGEYSPEQANEIQLGIISGMAHNGDVEGVEAYLNAPRGPKGDMPSLATTKAGMELSARAMRRKGTLGKADREAKYAAVLTAASELNLSDTTSEADLAAMLEEGSITPTQHASLTRALKEEGFVQRRAADPTRALSIEQAVANADPINMPDPKDPDYVAMYSPKDREAHVEAFRRNSINSNAVTKNTRDKTFASAQAKSIAQDIVRNATPGNSITDTKLVSPDGTTITITRKQKLDQAASYHDEIIQKKVASGEMTPEHGFKANLSYAQKQGHYPTALKLIFTTGVQAPGKAVIDMKDEVVQQVALKGQVDFFTTMDAVAATGGIQSAIANGGLSQANADLYHAVTAMSHQNGSSLKDALLKYGEYMMQDSSIRRNTEKAGASFIEDPKNDVAEDLADEMAETDASESGLGSMIWDTGIDAKNPLFDRALVNETANRYVSVGMSPGPAMAQAAKDVARDYTHFQGHTVPRENVKMLPQNYKESGDVLLDAVYEGSPDEFVSRDDMVLVPSTIRGRDQIRIFSKSTGLPLDIYGVEDVIIDGKSMPWEGSISHTDLNNLSLIADKRKMAASTVERTERSEVARADQEKRESTSGYQLERATVDAWKSKDEFIGSLSPSRYSSNSKKQINPESLSSILGKIAIAITTPLDKAEAARKAATEESMIK